ncbi:MAG: serine hydrolase [Saprospiraceae bacterium]|nr:serine hydrolase [Saprospiraceae bacterium]
MKPCFTLLLLFLITFVQAQNYYYPPNESDQWETMELDELGWCQENVDSLIQFLDEKNSKSFIILKEGKMVVEHYFDSFTQDSLWYWASCSKSLMAVLLGLSQEDGVLNIEDVASEYLGTEWTSCETEDEQVINIRHLISMASGFDDAVEPAGSINNCFEPECYECLAEPETRWAYHNSAYRITQDILEMTTGMTKNLYTRNRLGNPIGMDGFWFNYIYFSKARDMARFGLFTLSEGSWDGNQIIQDQSYYNAMISSSQDINQSYGYLWWLNGQESYMIPSLQFQFNGPIMPNAPSDLFAALGKNDQKIYIVPSLDMVVVRQGNDAGGSPLAVSSFDNQLWEKIMELGCLTNTTELEEKQIAVFPNPVSDVLFIQNLPLGANVELFTTRGRQVLKTTDAQLNLSSLSKGIYVLKVTSLGEQKSFKIVKQ